jgi:16S rRNA (guanine527-N7)-methyltransferase
VPGADEGTESPTPLHEVLAEAREAGFLGPGPIEPQLRHAEGFTAIARRLAADGPPRPRVVDLGSGGGLPGLVVATSWPEATVDLLESGARRAAFLERATSRLGLAGRVTVLHERAEVCGRQAGFRGGYDGVLARSFGRPAVVAECAAPLLKVGGWLVVSEPPRGGKPVQGDEAPRWPPEPLGQFGLEPRDAVHEEFDYRILRQTAPCPDRFPRRNGVPAKKPLF